MTSPRPGRIEATVQLGLMLAVGGLAGAGAFSRVVELAVDHGQPTWLAVADAAVIETMAVSAGLEIRRRRRAGQHAGLPAAVLIGAVVLSLAAQVAQAEPTAWGRIMAAVPAVGFLVLAKFALSRTPGTGPAMVPAADLTAAEQRTADVLIRAAAAEQDAAELRAVLGQDRVESGPESDGTGRDEPDPLLPVAREIAVDHEREGRTLTRASLLTALRDRGQGIATSRASDLLRQVRAPA